MNVDLYTAPEGSAWIYASIMSMHDIKKVLRNNNVALVNQLKLDDNLLTHLVHNRILSEANEDEIMVCNCCISSAICRLNQTVPNC